MLVAARKRRYLDHQRKLKLHKQIDLHTIGEVHFAGNDADTPTEIRNELRSA